MELSAANVWQILRLSVLDPGRAAAFLLGLPLGGAMRFGALGVVAALSAVALWGTYALFPMTLPDGSVPAPVTPISWAVMIGGGILLTSGLIFVCSRVAKGRAAFTDLVLLVSWFQFLQLSLYVVQMVLIMLLPPVGVLMTLGSVVLTVWVLGHFIKVANGFASVLGPILGIVGGTVLIFLILLSGA